MNTRLTRPKISPGMMDGHSPEALLPDAWPVFLLFAAYPLWWLLGLGGFVWAMFALPMLLRLMRQRKVAVPVGFGVWLLFLAWMAASLLVIDDSARLMVAIHRASLYAAATILFVYVYNLAPHALKKVVGALASFWAGVVVLGLLAVVWPSLEFTSLMERILPRALLSSGYILELTHVRLAQIHDFLGFPIGRPTGPFAYTNQWGSAFALLTPFALMAFSLRLRRWRWLIPLAVVAPVPLVVSLDRGAWLSLGVGIVYVLFRMAIRAQVRNVVRVVLSVGMIAAVVVSTPLGGLVQERIATPHSNEGRLEIYGQVIEQVGQAPLFGYGGPREAQGPYLPQLGTQGALWLVLYSHGIPGAVLFVGFLLVVLWRTRRIRSKVQFWSHVVLLIGLVQLPYYGMLPAGIHILMSAAAISLRPEDLSLLGSRDGPGVTAGGRQHSLSRAPAAG